MSTTESEVKVFKATGEADCLDQVVEHRSVDSPLQDGLKNRPALACRYVVA